jgi:hypothetical protein
MPAKDVKAYVKRNKNDAADAEAICEAVRRPTMRFVRIKSAEQQGQLMLHRARGPFACHMQQIKRMGGYFGRIVGSPPGLPGGGITGVLPTSGVGARISGSTPGGGHSTPSERASLSPSGSARWPVVVPSGTAVPECGAGRIGAQSAARSGDGGAVRAGGVVGPGGAWAPATSAAAIITHERNSARFKSMQGKRPAPAEVPRCQVEAPTKLLSAI